MTSSKWLPALGLALLQATGLLAQSAVSRFPDDDRHNLNAALDDAFGDDLEDICHCRNVQSATRFERLVAELEARRRALDPERLADPLRAEGLDVPAETGETSLEYLERASRMARQTLVGRGGPIQDMIGQWREAIESLDRVLGNEINVYDSHAPPPPTDLEVELLRMLRRALADCREDDPVPPPPDVAYDARAGLLIDLPPSDAPLPDGPPPGTMDEALWAEFRNLCTGRYPDAQPGRWIQDAARGLDEAGKAEADRYHRMFADLAISMSTRGFYDWVVSDTDPAKVRKRCSDELFDSARVGLVVELGDPEGPRYSTQVDPPTGTPEPSIADQEPQGDPAGDLPSADAPDDPAGGEPPRRRGPPPGFTHVTIGANPSSNTPQSNHQTAGPGASSRIEDFFDPGRGVPHRPGNPPFDHVHITRDRWSSQFAPKDRHVTDGAAASSLKGSDPPPATDETDPDPITDLVLPQVQNSAILRLFQLMMLEALAGIGFGHLDPGEARLVPVVQVDAPSEPFLYIESLGLSTGPALRVYAIGDAAALEELSAPGVVLEPVSLTDEVRRQVQTAIRGVTGGVANGYCLEFLRQVPPAGTAFRVADRAIQAEAAPMRAILDASRRLRDEGALTPDSDPEAYFHSIRQWALWTLEQGFDPRAFETAFVERTRENFAAAGRPWTDEIEAVVRALVPNRRADIERILARAGS